MCENPEYFESGKFYCLKILTFISKHLWLVIMYPAVFALQKIYTWFYFLWKFNKAFLSRRSCTKFRYLILFFLEVVKNKWEFHPSVKQLISTAEKILQGHKVEKMDTAEILARRDALVEFFQKVQHIWKTNVHPLKWGTYKSRSCSRRTENSLSSANTTSFHEEWHSNNKFEYF